MIKKNKKKLSKIKSLALELTATPLIRAVAAVVVAVTLPTYWDAAVVVASEIS